MFPVALVNDALSPADFNQAQKLMKMLTAIQNAGDPTGSVTPDFQYQFCIDTSNAALYWASTAAAAGWKKLTP